MFISKEIKRLRGEIEVLKAQLEEPFVTVENVDYEWYRLALDRLCIESEEVTLRGKVDAIIDYLGIDVSVKQAEKIPAKLVVKKTKKGKR